MTLDIDNGALLMEAKANVKICQDQLSPYLCFATRNEVFRQSFGICSASAFLLWTLLDVVNEGPVGGTMEHLLWTLLFLKTYDRHLNLAGKCGVKKDCYRKWRGLFLQRLATMDSMVSSYLVLLFFFTCEHPHNTLLCHCFFID